jgi:hypothetical protein
MTRLLGRLLKIEEERKAVALFFPAVGLLEHSSPALYAHAGSPLPRGATRPTTSRGSIAASLVLPAAGFLHLSTSSASRSRGYSSGPSSSGCGPARPSSWSFARPLRLARVRALRLVRRGLHFTNIVLWSSANRMFTVRQKRLFGLIGAGEIVAAIAGGSVLPVLTGHPDGGPPPPLRRRLSPDVPRLRLHERFFRARLARRSGPPRSPLGWGELSRSAASGSCS